MSDLEGTAADPNTWLRYARSALAMAKIGHNHAGILLEDLCFELQQSGEKALKGLLLKKGIEAPRTHAIFALMTLIRQHGFEPPESSGAWVELTTYAVRTRYPGGPPVNEEDYKAAVRMAEEIVDWVSTELSQ